MCTLVSCTENAFLCVPPRQRKAWSWPPSFSSRPGFLTLRPRACNLCKACFYIMRSSRNLIALCQKQIMIKKVDLCTNLCLSVDCVRGVHDCSFARWDGWWDGRNFEEGMAGGRAGGATVANIATREYRRQRTPSPSSKFFFEPEVHTLLNYVGGNLRKPPPREIPKLFLKSGIWKVWLTRKLL